MPSQPTPYLSSLATHLASLPIAARTDALTYLYALRTAAVEDLADSHHSQHEQHWDAVLGSTDAGEVKRLVRELVQLDEEEMAVVSELVEKSVSEQPTEPQAQAQARDLSLYTAAQESLHSRHKTQLAERLKQIRDRIARGIEKGEDVGELEKVFHRLEEEFWEGRQEVEVEVEVEVGEAEIKTEGG